MNSKYALTNPISLITDKSREDFTREDLIKVIEEKQIERITFHYTALDGKLKELKLPIANSYQAARILTDGERVDGSSLFAGMVDVSLSDLYVVPVYKTAFLNPFDSGSLDFICRYLTKDGDLASFTMDNILINASRLFTRSTGLELHAMGELEFFLLSEPISRIYKTAKQRGYHSSAPFVKTGQILNEIIHHISQDKTKGRFDPHDFRDHGLMMHGAQGVPRAGVPIRYECKGFSRQGGGTNLIIWFPLMVLAFELHIQTPVLQSKITLLSIKLLLLGLRTHIPESMKLWLILLFIILLFELLA